MRPRTICQSARCGQQATFRGRCQIHAAEAERQRGTRQQRGYDADHVGLRAALAPQVASGTVICWRCAQRIRIGEAWDLGHDDNDRTIYRGPEHAGPCNRAAAGRASHQNR